MSDTVGQQLLSALDEVDQLRGGKAALQAEIERLIALNDDLQFENEHQLGMLQRQKAEITRLENDIATERDAWAKDCAEINRLQKILDGTERRECEYLALIEKHATEVERLQHRVHTLEGMLGEANIVVPEK